MDISDHHIQQVAASSHAGPASHALLPLNYLQHNLQSVDNYSPHMPINHNVMQPPLIISSPSLGGDHKAAAIRTAATSMSSSACLAFNTGNANTSPINSGLDHVPGLYKTTFDYAFNQIYDDQPRFFDVSGNDPHENMHSTGHLMDMQKQESSKTPAELNSVTKPITTTAFSSQAGHLSSCRDVLLKSEPEVDQFAPAPTCRLSINGYSSASTNGSFLHSLVDMESLREEAYNNDTRGADFENETRVASTSTPEANHQHQHLLDFSNFPSFPAQDTVRPHRSHRGNALHAIKENRPANSNHNVSCSHVGGAESTIGSTTSRAKVQAAPKRRKSQQKRIVCVPATGGIDRPTGECLPSDSWAWRKYGQKPIKNSPYPRSYYKCSSVKGCTARKQVERNPSDPMLIMITYTVEHSHPTASIADDQQLAHAPKPANEEEEEEEDDKLQLNGDEKQMSGNLASGDGNDAMSEESCEPISSEGNLNDISNEDVMISESKYVQLDLHAAKSEQYEHDNIDDEAGVFSSSSYFGSGKRSKADDDFFAQLGELPDLFGKNSGWPPTEGQAADSESISSTHINIDPFDLYYWP